MGADLFQLRGLDDRRVVLGALFVASLVRSRGTKSLTDWARFLLPLFLAAMGIITSMIGAQFVSVQEGGNRALTRGELIAAVIMLVGIF